MAPAPQVQPQAAHRDLVAAGLEILAVALNGRMADFKFDYRHTGLRI
jgi:hypothetical protein